MLFTLFLIAIGINLVMFIPAFIYKTDKLTDISYAVSFLVLAFSAYLLSEKTDEHLVLLLLVSAWSLRLGSFLFMRINRMKRDKRFDGMRERFFAFLRFWLLQGATVFVVLLSGLLFWQTDDTSSLAWWSILGMLTMLIGLVLEAAADKQKFDFSGNPKNKDKWIQSGVWKYSRHPNYLGEMLVWIGIYVYVSSVLQGNDLYWALLSPAYIIGLLLFVSGIPLLEKAADKKWGTDKKYQEYKKKTPVLLPKLW